MEIELVLIRHGRTQWNVDKRYLGHTDIGILDRPSAELSSLKRQLEDRMFQSIFCSDLKRCQETLEYIYPTSQEQIILDTRLREMDFGDWEGQTYEQLRLVDDYCNWLDDPQSITPPNGESWLEFKERIENFMETLTSILKDEEHVNSSSAILIVTHGGVIRQLLAMTVLGSTFWDFAADPGTLISLKLTLQDDKWVGNL
ncbi:histidine phosphatase family protein [Paenibacillus crassostreae]|uniref:Alpha-ribazole phosphatase n=1 Tax=Paenibacillus crassostreae TaxID=1763538 RepID=A0A167GIJ8_9BACL|nr:alpha-ribazole phosphatase family protein [Paenibacillus crassostreae]AOZ92144.1 hypothetical protein LPB68_07835 [Paenibacillus crassostreae]OAB77605.1 hypothetical protein PNBC_00915 [Paenibacillus crassostreae]